MDKGTSQGTKPLIIGGIRSISSLLTNKTNNAHQARADHNERRGPWHVSRMHRNQPISRQRKCRPQFQDSRHVSPS